MNFGGIRNVFHVEVPIGSTFFSRRCNGRRERNHEHAHRILDKLMNQGYSLVFGPVIDPKGVYGLGIVEADNEDQVRGFIQSDPAIKAGLMKPEFYPMNAIVPKK